MKNMIKLNKVKKYYRKKYLWYIIKKYMKKIIYLNRRLTLCIYLANCFVF